MISISDITLVFANNLGYINTWQQELWVVSRLNHPRLHHLRIICQMPK